ncbi:DsrE family protein [Shewanella youngdeokensis]|uniref:DsrE family protein n=1 Tax=Shewanella youngdeokensis TaxID=2999068 RepID=A0ABZ0K006_9GAMM|nr:DsrE family protein [Shewanella sp. DAU334]
MKTQYGHYLLAGSFLLCSLSVFAGPDDFKPGPVLSEYGNIAKVETQLSIPKDTVFKVDFDMSEAAVPGKLNRGLVKLARFINMHVSEGVPLSNLQLMMVVHGKAVNDFTLNEFYQTQQSQPQPHLNANIELISQLSQLGVRFYLCGQTTVYYDVPTEQLLPGVKVALSAMTAHAIAAQQGYSLNPF